MHTNTAESCGTLSSDESIWKRGDTGWPDGQTQGGQMSPFLGEGTKSV